jgi:hypothetical protein
MLLAKKDGPVLERLDTEGVHRLTMHASVQGASIGLLDEHERLGVGLEAIEGATELAVHDLARISHDM